MKRYLVFSSSNYYPAGGWDDFRGDAETLEEAIVIAKAQAAGWWWQVVDTQTKEVVDSGEVGTP